MVLVLVLITLGVAAYGGLIWYPVRAAADLMVPAAEDFARAFGSFRDTVDRFSDGGTGGGDGAEPFLETADAARASLADGRGRLEEDSVTSIPVVSSRPPLRLARDIRERMLGFYTGALELLADLEAVARYLTELSPLLPQFENLETAIDDPQTPAEVRRMLAAARPIVDQVRADLRALVPPGELGPLHAGLLAILGQARSDLREIEGVAGSGASPVLTALLDDLRSQAKTFRDEVAGGPRQARRAGLARRIGDLGEEARLIAEDLSRLRDDHGINGLTVPAV